MAEKNLYYLDELTDYKVASDDPDVRGWEVQDSSGKTVGKVENLLVSKSAKRVVYLDVDVDESLRADAREATAKPATGVHTFTNKEGENHLIIPIGMVDLDEDNNIVKSREISRDTFRSAKRYKKGTSIDPDYEILVFTHYVPKGNTGETRVDDDFYNKKQFQRRR